jgi:hypothetical protein
MLLEGPRILAERLLDPTSRRGRARGEVPRDTG